MEKFSRMIVLFLLAVIAISSISKTLAAAQQQQYYEEEEEDDDEFGDFDDEQVQIEEEFPDDEEPQLLQPGHAPSTEDTDDVEEAIVESDDVDEFSHLSDEEEFIGYNSESGNPRNSYNKKEAAKEPKITIANVPLHLRSNWDSFYLELILLAGLLIYFINFSVGRGKNARLANAWFGAHKALLCQQFALVGDDGKAAGIIATDGSEQGPVEKSVVTNSKGCYDLLKESENNYSLYCSGRYSVHSMMVELRFIKRQDLVSLMAGILRPCSDEAIIKLRLDDMDNVVLCLATKKVTNKYVKEMADLSTYCPGDRKTTLPTKQYGAGGSKIFVWSELAEASQSILTDPRTVAVVSKNLSKVNYLHISDQYSGAKQQDQEQTGSSATNTSTLPEVHKMIILSVQLLGSSGEEEDMEQLRPFMLLVLHLADKLARFRLSREGKTKTVKNRSRVEELFMKATHADRAQRAQEKREEKKREEREKMMEIDDPERQRKWEDRENRRQAKKKGPKMKQLKIA